MELTDQNQWFTFIATGLNFVDHMAKQRQAGFLQLFAEMPKPQCQQVISALETLIDYLGHVEVSS